MSLKYILSINQFHPLLSVEHGALRQYQLQYDRVVGQNICNVFLYHMTDGYSHFRFTKIELVLNAIGNEFN